MSFGVEKRIEELTEQLILMDAHGIKNGPVYERKLEELFELTALLKIYRDTWPDQWNYNYRNSVYYSEDE